MKAHADLYELQENSRIDVIVRELRANPGLVIGVAVDTEPENAKAKRYLQKIQAKAPECICEEQLVDRIPGVTILKMRCVVEGRA